MLTLRWPRTTPRLACPSDCIFLRKFTLLLFTFSWKCPLFWAFYFFYSSSYKYNCLVQDYGRILYTLVSFSQLKGFLDVGCPPFFKFHEKWILLFSSSIVFEYIHFQFYVWNFYFHQSYHLRLYGSSTQEFSSPRFWVWGWIFYYITKIEQIDSFQLMYSSSMNDFLFY